jgi:hypothetical protein
VDDEGRSQVRKYSQVSVKYRSPWFRNVAWLICLQKNKFCVGDKVKIIQTDGSRKGPYYVASVVSTGLYTLSDADGSEVEDGDEIEENDLKVA